MSNRSISIQLWPCFPHIGTSISLFFSLDPRRKKSSKGFCTPHPYSGLTGHTPEFVTLYRKNPEWRGKSSSSSSSSSPSSSCLLFQCGQYCKLGFYVKVGHCLYQPSVYNSSNCTLSFAKHPQPCQTNSLLILDLRYCPPGSAQKLRPSIPNIQFPWWQRLDQWWTYDPSKVTNTGFWTAAGLTRGKKNNNKTLPIGL